MHFVYSGNFIGQVELGQFDTVRVGMGIHPENFCWKLEKGESFQTPEVVLVYSDTGYDGMTHQPSSITSISMPSSDAFFAMESNFSVLKSK